MLSPYRIPHTDIAIFFEDDKEAIRGDALPEDGVNFVLRTATTRLTMQVERDGDSRLPLSPQRLTLRGRGIEIWIATVQVSWYHIRYSDAIDVLRAVGTIMRREGYHEWETDVTSTFVEEFYGKVSIRKTSLVDSS